MNNNDDGIVEEHPTVANLVNEAMKEMEDTRPVPPPQMSEIIVPDSTPSYEGYLKEGWKMWRPIFVKIGLIQTNAHVEVERLSRAEQARARHTKRAKGRYANVGKQEVIEIAFMLIIALCVGVLGSLLVLDYRGDGFAPSALTPYYKEQYLEAISARYAYSGNDQAAYNAMIGWESGEDVCAIAFQADGAGDVPRGMRFLALMYIMEGDIGVAECVQSQGGLK